MVKMQPVDLLTICLDTVYGRLREGVWDSCIPNPFSNLPTCLVDRLMDLTKNLSWDHSPNLNDVTLLLKSGNLRRLNLCPFGYQLQDTINNNLVSQIICWNPHIEEAHLFDPSNFIFFKNYRSLRILRFYERLIPSSGIPRKRQQTEDGEKSFELSIDSVLPSLSNLKELHIPNIDTGTMVKILDTCPKIISLGLVDTLDTMEEIDRLSMNGSLSNIKYGSHLQLRRCCWGKDSTVNCSKSSLDREKFIFKTKCAVNLCPLVEELIFYTKYTGVITEFRSLKKLTLLKIEIRDRDADFVSEFIELLQYIGLQLKHLFVFGFQPVPIDSICECCPNLESLDIDAPLFVKNSGETSGDLPLKRIRVRARESAANKESIEFLLPKCKQLEKLYLSRVLFLDDRMLDKILKINPFAKLNWINIYLCSLSEEGFDMLLSSAESIRTINICSTKAISSLIKNLLPYPNLKFSIEEEEEDRDMKFIPQLNGNRF